MIKKIKSYYFELIILCALSIVFLMCFYNLKYKVENMNLQFSIFGNGLIYFIVCAILLLLFIAIVLLIRKKTINNNNVHWWFLFFSLFLGTIYLLLAPFFTGSDEHNHFYRIYEISSGTMITPSSKIIGSELPRSLNTTFLAGGGTNIDIKYNNISDMAKVKLNKDKTMKYGKTWDNQYNNTALYSPLQYLPHVIGIKIGTLFTDSVYYLGIFSRFFNLLFYSLIGTIALKILPKNKLFIGLVLLSPVMLQCAATLSADAFTLSMVVLYISYLLKCHYQSKKLKIYDFVIMTFLAIMISLCKIVYLPFVFLMILLGNEKFEHGKKQKWIYIFITMLLSVIISLLWLSVTDPYFNVAYPNSDLQKAFVFSNPIEYIVINIRTYCMNLASYIENMFIGNEMYHSQLKIPSLFSYIYIFIIILSLFNDQSKNTINKYFKYFVGLIMFGTVVLLNAALYVQCTAQFSGVGLEKITGIQGRYFIPIFVLIIFLIPKIKTKLKIKQSYLYEIALALNFIVFSYMMIQFSIYL